MIALAWITKVLGQNWGLQIMCLICGVCWSMSQRPAASYASRLVIYFCLGTSCNWLAWVATGADWRSLDISHVHAEGKKSYRAPNPEKLAKQ